MDLKYKFIRPSLPDFDAVKPFLEAAYELGHFTNFGPACVELERRVTQQFAAPEYRAITVTNATLGLQVVLESLGVTGKHVIVPDFTFPATLHAVTAAGAIPLVCDVNLATSELDPDIVREVLTRYDNVAAVVPVRCFGMRRDISQLVRICAELNVPVVVDAAACLGDHRQDVFGSSLNEIEVFSLHTTKVFAAGEGGIIIAPESLAADLKRRTNFGISQDRSFVDGTNAKMDEFRCAVGLATMERLPDIIRQRSTHAGRLQDIFDRSSRVLTFDVDATQNWCNFPVYCRDLTGDELARHFLSKGIEVKRYYYPTLSAGYRGEKTLDVHSSENSVFLADKIVCVPVYSEPVAEEFFTLIGDVVSEIEDGP